MTTIVRRRKLGLTSVKGIIAASERDDIRYANNWEGIPHDDVYIRWGCTSNLPNRNAKVINAAKGIHRVADKRGFRLDMTPVENLCPYTWGSVQAYLQSGYDQPVVVRPATHSQGKHTYLCRTHEEVNDAVLRCGPNHYVAEYINKVAEYRVFVMQGRVVWVARKTPGNPNDVAWNVAKGGRFDNVRWGDWPMNVISCALRVWDMSKLHFSGIDIMVDEAGRAYCVEANSAPSQTSPYRQSCVAKAFDWMVNRELFDRKVYDYPAGLHGWKSVIHPALR